MSRSVGRRPDGGAFDDDGDIGKVFAGGGVLYVSCNIGVAERFAGTFFGVFRGEHGWEEEGEKQSGKYLFHELCVSFIYGIGSPLCMGPCGTENLDEERFGSQADTGGPRSDTARVCGAVVPQGRRWRSSLPVSGAAAAAPASMAASAVKADSRAMVRNWAAVCEWHGLSEVPV